MPGRRGRHGRPARDRRHRPRRAVREAEIQSLPLLRAAENSRRGNERRSGDVRCPQERTLDLRPLPAGHAQVDHGMLPSFVPVPRRAHGRRAAHPAVARLRRDLDGVHPRGRRVARVERGRRQGVLLGSRVREPRRLQQVLHVQFRSGQHRRQRTGVGDCRGRECPGTRLRSQTE